MRTALIVGGAAVVVWWLWQRGTLAPVLQALGPGLPSAGAASMVPGAAAQTTPGVRPPINIFGPRPAPILTPGVSLLNPRNPLLLVDAAPPPVALTPLARSGTTLGNGPAVLPYNPPPQQLQQTINFSATGGYRGIF